MDGEGQRAQPAIGADIAGRLLAADMLLAVDRVSTQPRLPEASTVSPHRRPGICRRNFSRVANSPT